MMTMMIILIMTILMMIMIIVIIALIIVITMIIVMKDNYIQSQLMATLERFLLLPEIRIASVHKKTANTFASKST